MKALLFASVALTAAAAATPKRLSAPGKRAAAPSPPLGEYSDTSSLNITFQDGSMVSLRHSDALFGVSNYGGSLRSRVYYPDATKTNTTGCDPTGLAADTAIPPGAVILLDRGGGCSFTAKVLAAQKAGAAAAIVVDTHGLCGVSPSCGRSACSRCPLSSSDPSCLCTLPYMADDGDGFSVSIPSFMISSTDGATIKPFARSGKGQPAQVTAAMSWALPAPDDRVELDTWLDVVDPDSARWRESFSPYVPYLGKTILFTPQFFIIDGRAEGCQAGGGYDCGDQCINGGWYCHFGMSRVITGAAVVIESLRQACVWRVVNGSSTSAAQYFTYADGFNKYCGTDATWNEACAEAQIRAADIALDAVKACMTASNATVNPGTSDYTNILLQESLNLQNDMRVLVIPTAIVNDIRLNGRMDGPSTLIAVCAGYAPGTAPPVCDCTTVAPAQLEACVQSASGQSTDDGGKGLPGWAAALIALFALGSIAGVGVSYYLHRRTRTEVQDMLDDYRALMEHGEDTTAANAGRLAGGGHGAASERSGSVVDRVRSMLAPPAAAPTAGGAPGRTGSLNSRAVPYSSDDNML